MMAAAGLARLEGRDMGVGIMWWRGGGVEDPACGVKRVSVTLVKKGTKKNKRKNISLLACPRWRRQDLRGLRGNAQWRGGGLRTRHVGKRGLCNTGQKRNKKRRKTYLTYVPTNEAMAVVGLARLDG